MSLLAKYHDWITADGLSVLQAYARDGLTDEQIAANVGIAPSTLYVWKNKFPEISEALKRGKEPVDVAVENALLKRAMGYEYIEERVDVETNAEGSVLNRKVTQITKQVAPDVAAIIFWLRNRKAVQWRNNPEESVKKSDTSLMESLLDLGKRRGFK